MRFQRALTVLALVAMGTMALASIKMQGDFTKLVKPAPESELAKASCLVCHTAMGKKDLNGYGKDLAAALKAMKKKDLSQAVLNRIAKLDSDKDKVSNGDELKAGTNPGDPKSKPQK